MSETQPFSADHAARQRIRQSLDESLLVEAAAGTGKTTVLVDRLVAILSRGDTQIDRIVAVTFTRKAAGELKLRLRQELGKARERAAEDVSSTEIRERLEEAIARLEEAHIGTIHSFCAEILRQRPVEAGIDPGFIELDEQESASLFDRAFQSWIEEQLNAMPAGLRRALSRLARRPGSPSGSPIDALREAARSLVDWRDFDGPWERLAFDREELINHLVEQVNELAELSRRGTPRDALSKALEPVTGVEAWVRFSEEASEQRDFDAVEAQMVELLAGLKDKLNWRGNTVNFARDLPRQQVLDARDQMLDALEVFKQRADADLAITLRSELLGVLELYERLKTHSGRLDFLDLLLYCRNLLRDRPDVRQFFQERFSHLFVDEFQDTDPLQTEILLLLVADDPAVDHWRLSAPAAGKLFLVADPKQSIYRFRRADVLLYQEVKDHLAASGVGVVHLSRSFRATARLQQAINHAFEKHMSEDRERGQPGYVALEGDRLGAVDQPSLIALPAPAPFGYRGRPTKTAVAKCLPDVTAAFIEFLLRHSGWQVADQAAGGDLVAIAPRHICLLFRRFQSWGKDITDPYLRALEARDIPHLLVGGRSLHQREEVETLRAALTAIEWPDDTLAVYATLRGSLFALTDDLLLRFHQQVGHLEPFRTIGDDLEEDLRPVVEVLELIEALHRQRNEIPIAETLNRLLEYCRAHAAFALRHSGHQVLANVQRIIDMARGFEVRGGLSFRGFVERLDREAENPRTRYTPVLEEGAEGVRIMNTHTAKGLEFPIVILADLGANLTPMEPSLAIDPESKLAALKILGCAPWDLRQRIEVERHRDRAEGVRVAYVAATRARDLLVVTAVGSGPFGNGWLSPLDDAVYPPSQSFRAATEAPGCPPFGPTTILKPPLDGPPPPTIQPGLHRPKIGDHEVVWWDPRTLRLGVPGRFGVRKDKLLHPDPDGEANQDGLDRYLDWQDRRDEAFKAGQQPSCDVLTVTDTEQWPPGTRPTIELEWLAAAAPSASSASTASRARPSGIRFGTLVHTILRDVDLDASVSAIGELSRLHGRVLDAEPDEVTAATEAVAKTLEHPLLQRAASAERLCRETPFHLRLEGGFQIEGTVDLAFRDDAGQWIVVDYKTDQDLEAVVDTYQRQISWYVYALEQLTGEPVRGVLLGI